MQVLLTIYSMHRPIDRCTLLNGEQFELTCAYCLYACTRFSDGTKVAIIQMGTILLVSSVLTMNCACCASFLMHRFSACNVQLMPVTTCLQVYRTDATECGDWCRAANRLRDVISDGKMNAHASQPPIDPRMKHRSHTRFRVISGRANQGVENEKFPRPDFCRIRDFIARPMQFFAYFSTEL